MSIADAICNPRPRSPKALMGALRRFYVRSGAILGDRISVHGPEAHHIAVVLRLRPGDQLIAFDGSSLERVVELDTVERDVVRGRIVKIQEGTRLSLVLSVLQGIPKGGKMDTVVQMGTELGVAQFVPVQFRRSIGSVGSRLPRWRRIAIEAAKQARRADVPLIAEPVTLSEALELVADYDRMLLLWESEKVRSLAVALREAPVLSRVAVIVGPEGGLDPVEVRKATGMGALPVTLGPFVVRTEHAAVVAVSMVLYELMARHILPQASTPPAST